MEDYRQYLRRTDQGYVRAAIDAYTTGQFERCVELCSFALADVKSQQSGRDQAVVKIILSAAFLLVGEFERAEALLARTTPAEWVVGGVTAATPAVGGKGKHSNNNNNGNSNTAASKTTPGGGEVVGDSGWKVPGWANLLYLWARDFVTLYGTDKYCYPLACIDSLSKCAARAHDLAIAGSIGVPLWVLRCLSEVFLNEMNTSGALQITGSAGKKQGTETTKERSPTSKIPKARLRQMGLEHTRRCPDEDRYDNAHQQVPKNEMRDVRDELDFFRWFIAPIFPFKLTLDDEFGPPLSAVSILNQLLMGECDFIMMRTASALESLREIFTWLAREGSQQTMPLMVLLRAVRHTAYGLECLGRRHHDNKLTGDETAGLFREHFNDVDEFPLVSVRTFLYVQENAMAYKKEGNLKMALWLEMADEHPSSAESPETLADRRSEMAAKAICDYHMALGFQAGCATNLAGHISAGLKVEQFDNKLHGQILCNRSSAYYARGQYKEALADAQKAFRVTVAYTKAAFRGGRAALKLGKFVEGSALVQAGLDAEVQGSTSYNQLVTLLQELQTAKALTETQNKLVGGMKQRLIGDKMGTSGGSTATHQGSSPSSGSTATTTQSSTVDTAAQASVAAVSPSYSKNNDDDLVGLLEPDEVPGAAFGWGTHWIPLNNRPHIRAFHAHKLAALQKAAKKNKEVVISVTPQLNENIMFLSWFQRHPQSTSGASSPVPPPVVPDQKLHRYQVAMDELEALEYLLSSADQTQLEKEDIALQMKLSHAERMADEKHYGALKNEVLLKEKKVQSLKDTARKEAAKLTVLRNNELQRLTKEIQDEQKRPTVFSRRLTESKKRLATEQEKVAELRNTSENAIEELALSLEQAEQEFESWEIDFKKSRVPTPTPQPVAKMHQTQSTVLNKPQQKAKTVSTPTNGKKGSFPTTTMAKAVTATPSAMNIDKQKKKKDTIGVLKQPQGTDVNNQKVKQQQPNKKETLMKKEKKSSVFVDPPKDATTGKVVIKKRDLSAGANPPANQFSAATLDAQTKSKVPPASMAELLVQRESDGADKKMSYWKEMKMKKKEKKM